MKVAFMLRRVFVAALFCQLLIGNKLPSQTADAYSSPGHRFAILIGVSEYDDSQLPRLSGPTNDTQSLANALVQSAGFPLENVVILTSRQATRENVLNAFFRLSKRVPENSLIFVSFSGYGFAKNEQLYLLPYDGVVHFVEQSAIPLSTLDEVLSMRQSLHAVLILDTSFKPLDSSPSSAPFGQYPINSNFRSTKALKAVYSPSDASYEDPGLRQGLFTQAVVKGLEGGAWDQRGDITTASLAAYIDDSLSRDSLSKRGSTTHLQYFLSSNNFVISTHAVESKPTNSSVTYFVRASIRPSVDLPEPITQTFQVNDKGECTLRQTRSATFCIDGDEILKVGEYHTTTASCDSKPLGSSVNGRCLNVDYALHGCIASNKCSPAQLSFDFSVEGVKYTPRFLQNYEPDRVKVSASVTTSSFQYPGNIPQTARNIQWTYHADVFRISGDDVISDIVVTNSNPVSAGVKSSISGDGRLIVDVSDALGEWGK